MNHVNQFTVPRYSSVTTVSTTNLTCRTVYSLDERLQDRTWKSPALAVLGHWSSVVETAVTFRLKKNSRLPFYKLPWDHMRPHF